MSLLRTRLTVVFPVPDTVGAIYTNPAAKKSFVRGITLINTDDSNEHLVDVHWVQPDTGGSPGDADRTNKILSQITLAANETFTWDIPYALVMLDENETIQAEADEADKVNIIVHGDQE